MIGCTVNVAWRVVPPADAEIVTVVGVDTSPVVIGKNALCAAAGTVTLAGTAATDGLLLDSVTTVPPGSAGTSSVIDPVNEQLACGGVPAIVNDARETGSTVSVA